MTVYAYTSDAHRVDGSAVTVTIYADSPAEYLTVFRRAYPELTPGTVLPIPVIGR